MQRGWAWLRDGFLLWRRNPALLTFATFAYILILLLLSSVPILGQAIASLLMPVLSLGVLNTCRAVDEGRKGGPDLLFSGFKSNLPALVTIGGIYLIASLALLGITSMVDDGTLMRFLRGELDLEAGERPEFGFSLIVMMILGTPIMMAYWFAPILAGWWSVTAPKAMFFSFYACLQNWRPFLAYGLSLLVIAGILPGVLIGLIGAAIPLLASLLLLIVPLVLIPSIFASFYINAREVFATVKVDEQISD